MQPSGAGADLPFHPAVQEWFARSFTRPTPAQAGAWPPIARGDSTLLLAPTGSGKTLAAFLSCLDRLIFSPEPEPRERLRVVYVSPLKALAVDVERNLRAPLQGIVERARERGDVHRLPAVAVRSGDTPARERARFARGPADILVTTPESLYLLLTSAARERLRSVETVILDEIHALVPTKRGAHLALSLERLEALTRRRLQRIGLSATQRPLDEVARFLGGAEVSVEEVGAAGPGGGEAGARWRPVTIVDAGKRKALELRVEVPVEDMARLAEPVESPGGLAVPAHGSIWTAIHPRLLELVRAHRSTLLFVNSRRVAERLAAALNELAGETLVHAHHGSLARPQRVAVEEALKAGTVRGLVATSSLELGIDMGAIDLVIQIEAAPSVASALQRVGRAGHQLDARSRGVFFPKFRADLLACAAQIEAMEAGDVEESRYPRSPLDVLAQQLVAMGALDEWPVERAYALVRAAAPFAGLSRTVFEGVLDLLAGRYPSDELTDLQPRLVWDRVRGRFRAREGARRIAVVNAGTIPDRGLYGVFLLGAPPGQGRVGELDEEMVFESKVGDAFFLGASTWRIEAITHDRVVVSPAPGEPGRMPFWKGDAPGRPLELGRRIGRLARELQEAPPEAARARLAERHGLDRSAAENLLRFLADQRAATGAVPDDRTVVVERVRDELGDWRVCVLSPFGAPVLVPWCLAAAARARDALGIDPETLWTNDGFVVRLPDAPAPPDVAFLFPAPEEVEAIVTAQLGATPLFAGKFREAAGRALLLPRRRPGGRTPLWQRRKRATDLLGVASRYPEFPILLESYRECLRDVFDLPALVDVLADVRSGAVRTVTVDTRVPSPFAASLLFGFVASFMYDGDAPLAERRAQALAIDQVQLRELLGEAELRELLDAAALRELEERLQHRAPELRARSADAVADLLLRLGDLSRAEVRERAATGEVAAALDRLVAEGRAVELPVAGEARFVAVEDAARYRDALGAALPPGLPEVFLAPVEDALAGILARWARRHGPFTTGEAAARFGLSPLAAEAALEGLLRRGRLLEGAFRPGGTEREWCDPEVLRTLRRRSLARLREEVEPVEPAALGRALLAWHGVSRRRGGLDAVLDAVEKLQGAPLPASLLETELLPARVEGYLPGDLDALAAGGEVVWVGLEPVGAHDGRVALFLADALPRLLPAPGALGPARGEAEVGERERRILEHLAAHGASFFAELHAAAGGGFAPETSDALWALAWRGLVTNDTFQALRAFTRGPEKRERARRAEPPRSPLENRSGFALAPSAGGARLLRPGARLLRPGAGGASAYRSRLAAPPSAGGRWTLVEARRAQAAGATSVTARLAATAHQLLARHGVVTRGAVAAEGVPGGFAAVYEVLRHLEEAGRIRRGYFVAGVGAMQFALPAALEAVRAAREPAERAEVAVLAAADPASPWGSALEWPPLPDDAGGRRPTRAVGARVVLVDGAPALWLSPAHGLSQLLAWLPAEEPERARVGLAVAHAVLDLARASQQRFEGVRVEEINGAPAAAHPLAEWLARAGFVASGSSLLLPRRAVPVHPR